MRWGGGGKAEKGGGRYGKDMGLLIAGGEGEDGRVEELRCSFDQWLVEIETKASAVMKLL